MDFKSYDATDPASMAEMERDVEAAQQLTTAARKFKFTIWDETEDEGEEQYDAQVEAATPEEARELALDEFLDARIIEAYELIDEGWERIDYDDEALLRKGKRRQLELVQAVEESADVWASSPEAHQRIQAYLRELRELIQS